MKKTGTESDSLTGIDLAADEGIIVGIKKAIEMAAAQGSKGIILDDGQSEIIIEIRPSNQNTGEYIVSIGGQDVISFIETIDEETLLHLEGVLGVFAERFELERAEVRTAPEEVAEKIEEQKGTEVGNKPKKEPEKDTNTQNTDLIQAELDNAIKTGNAVPLRLGREITEGEDIHMMLKRMFGQDFVEVYRVRGKGTHDFDYIGKTTSGKYEKVNASQTREGTNPLQKIIIMRKDGTFEEKTVDHLIVRGRYAIATDMPDGTGISERTYTFICVRGPGEKYLAIEALDDRTNEASNDTLIKSNMNRDKSVYEIEDVADAAVMAQKIESLAWDGKFTSEEVELVKKLTVEKALNEGEVIDFLEFVHELKKLGLNDTEVKAILDSAKMTIEQVQELERNDICDAKEVNAVFQMMEKDNMSFADAVNKLKEQEDRMENSINGHVCEDDARTPWGDAEKRMLNIH
ncbi:MAG: hypothetical protein FWC53_04255 [Firmicutes bacterium]|nr:hypothetical protein [Bacillota bacterium]